MAIAFAELTQGAGSHTSSVSTASISPTSGAVVFLGLAVARPSGVVNATFTPSGNGLTWTSIGTVDWGGRRKIFVWRGTGTPSAGVITISHDLGEDYDHAWSVDEATGVDGTTPVGSLFSNSGTGATSLSVTVSETPDAGDFVYAFFADEDTAWAPSLNSELDTVLTDLNGGANVRAILAAYDSAPDSTPVPGVTWTGASDVGGVAFIINAAAGGGGAAVLQPRGIRAVTSARRGSERRPA